MTIEKHQEEEMDEIQTFILEDADGNQYECCIIAQLDFEGKQYVAVRPISENEFVVMEYIEESDDGGFGLEPIDNDELEDTLMEMFTDYLYPDEEDGEYEVCEDEDDEAEEE